MRKKRMGLPLGRRAAAALLCACLLLGMMPTAAMGLGAAEPPTIYLNGVSGNDDNGGTTAETAVKTFDRVRYLLTAAATGNTPGKNPAGGPGTVVVTGTVTEKASSIWGNLNAAAGALTVKRGDGFKDAMLVVDTKGPDDPDTPVKSVRLKNGIVIDGAGEGVTAPAIVLKSGKLYASDSSTAIQNNCNTALDVNGGGILVEGGLLDIWFEPGMAIQRNSAASGGGIYVKSGAEVKLTGSDNSSITGNTASGKGGGIYMESGATLTFANGGKIDISGNLVDSEENNVYLAEGAALSTGDLSKNSIIGITTEATPNESDVITVARLTGNTAWPYTLPAFVSDNASYRMALNADEKSVVLRLPQAVVHLGGEGRSDQNSGRTADTAVATIDQAIALVEDGGTVVVCGKTTAPTEQTIIDKALTFTGAYQEADYSSTASLKLNHPYFKKNIVFQNMKISNVSPADGLYRYYPIDGAQLTLENVAFLEKETVLQAQSSPDENTYGLTIKNCPSLFLYGIMYFDSVALDHSVVETFYFTGTTEMYVLNVTLQNASHLMTRQAIGNLTSVGAGNILTTQPNSKTGVARQLNGTVSITPDNPILLHVRNTRLSEGLGVLTSAAENTSLIPDKFYLEDGSFYLTKIGNTLTAMKNQLATGIPDGITTNSVQLHGSVRDITGVSAPGFRWWKVGDETKTTVDAACATAFSAAVDGLTPDTEYAYEAVATVGGNIHTGGTVYFRTAKERTPTGGIEVEIVGPNDTLLAVTVSIEAGNTVLAAQSGNTTESAPFSASFTALPDGFYNIVVRTDSYTETRLTEVAEGATKTQSFTIPSGMLSSVVKIKTPDTPKVAVDQLKNVITPQEEEEAAAGTKSVEALLEVEKQAENPADDVQAAIRASAGSQTIGAFLDLNLLKTTTVLATNEVTTKNVGADNSVVLEIAVPFDTSGKNNFNVYRHHGGEPEALTPLSVRPVVGFEDGTYFVENGYLFVYAKKFSTYAVAYDIPSGGSVTTYTITATAGEGGSISPNGKVRVNRGGRKTFTITPDEGYEVADVLVDGKRVGAVSEYVFQSVKAGHTITAAFQKADGRAAWNPFEDVHEDDWFHDEVKYAYENGLMIGTTDTTFSPYLNTSRGMIVTILWRLENCPAAPTAASFPDVAPGQYYAQAVAWGGANGIVLGYDNGNFGPDDPITREQLAAILWRYARHKGEDVSVGQNANILSYPDYPQISAYAIPALRWAVGAGIMRGKGGGILDPTGAATRAEAAAMLARFPLAAQKTASSTSVT